MKRLCLTVLAFFILFLLATDLRAQDESQKMKEKLQKAMRELKNEIRLDVAVENPGIITGKVKCRRTRHSGDTVVYIEKAGDNNFEPPEEHGVVDQLNLIFVPHVIAVQKGTTIDFPNSDLVRHNVFSTPDSCNQFNLGTYDIGASKPVTFNESCEVPLLCNVHAEMSAYVVVLDNPYFAVTAKDGNFKVDNVPPGTYKLKTWHEKLRSEEQDVSVEGGRTVEVNFTLKKRK
ncbi:plastocyanin [Candidatus Scalindua japonica]|uniref:Plastocyanin n=2 Tax=Candidatus Scalindua japonica TaxID=1284222 RepID=A0A286U2U4_9BACT|nr:carboxypeptidase regulatory-like domain-containing protein [Candidatus Scalindua japonica]GAX62447.1 plastocyanin [Candidatus Scalindua japonica]